MVPTQIGDVLQEPLRSPCKYAVILVGHGHDDKQLGSARGGIVDLTEGETVFPDTVQATSRGGTAHVG